MRTLRSNWLGFAAVLAILVAVGAVASFAAIDRADDSSPVPVVLTGANIAILLIGIFGALHGAREFTSRMITTSVAAVPRRWQIIVGKSISLLMMVLPVALVGVFAAFFIGMGILSTGDSATVTLRDDGVLTSVAGMAAWLSVVGLFGMALGIILRNVAASIGVIMAILLILPNLANALLPDSMNSVLKFLPSNAAKAFTGDGPGDTLSAPGGAVVAAIWVVIAIGAAAWSFQRRDV